MPQEEPERGFSVVDRRRRADTETEPAARETPPRSAAPPSATEPPESVSGPPRPDLASFCVMLYSDALVHLGQVPDPATGQPHPDLEQARFTIDLLGMLREKTEGNRTPEESAVLDQILATLQMGFVHLSRLA